MKRVDSEVRVSWDFISLCGKKGLHIWNSNNPALRQFGGDLFIVTTSESGEYWFTVGNYKTLNGAIKAGLRRLSKHGITLMEAR